MESFFSLFSLLFFFVFHRTEFKLYSLSTVEFRLNGYPPESWLLKSEWSLSFLTTFDIIKLLSWKDFRTDHFKYTDLRFSFNWLVSGEMLSHEEMNWFRGGGKGSGENSVDLKVSHLILFLFHSSSSIGFHFCSKLISFILVTKYSSNLIINCRRNLNDLFQFSLSLSHSFSSSIFLWYFRGGLMFINQSFQRKNC